MEEQQHPGTAAGQPEPVAAILGDIAERSRKLVEASWRGSKIWKRQRQPRAWTGPGSAARSPRCSPG
jgi:hypothetical protein